MYFFFLSKVFFFCENFASNLQKCFVYFYIQFIPYVEGLYKLSNDFHLALRQVFYVYMWLQKISFLQHFFFLLLFINNFEFYSKEKRNPKNSSHFFFIFFSPNYSGASNTIKHFFFLLCTEGNQTLEKLHTIISSWSIVFT